MSDATPLPAKLAPGDTLANGKYVVNGLIGAGAMGTVYSGEHRALKRKVAIKVMRPEVFENKPKAARRFEREARAAAQLDHRHSVRVLDFGNEGALHYLVMEYVEGRPLDAVIAEEGPMASDRAARLISQVCGALSKAHGEGTIHRDLKPQNILLLQSTDDEGFPLEEIKVCDFGIAKVSWSEPGEGDEALTEVGRVIGTPQYMSPEQCQAEEVDHRSDLYSVGCVMYFLVAGRHPFSGPTPLTTMLMHIQEPVTLPSQLNPAIDARFEQLILWAMQKQPEHRPASAAELKRYLYEILGKELNHSEVPETHPAIRAASNQEPEDPQEVAPATDTYGASTDSTEGSEQPSSRGPLKTAVAAVFGTLLLGLGAYALLGETAPSEVAQTRTTPAAIEPAKASTPSPPPGDKVDVKADASSEPGPNGRTSEKGVKTHADSTVSTPEPPKPKEASAKPTQAPPKSRQAQAQPKKPQLSARERKRKEAQAKRRAERKKEPTVSAPSKPPTGAKEPEVEAVQPKPAKALPTPPSKPPLPRVTPAPTAPTNFNAAVRLIGHSVRGSLPKSAIVKATKRLSGDFSQCYTSAAKRAGAAPAVKLRIRGTIDEDGRARSVKVSRSKLPGLTTCVQGKAKRLRSRTRPDTGTVDMSFEVHFVPRT